MSFPSLSPLTFSPGGASMLAMLRSLTLTSGLQVCFDAGDVASYASGQTWSDLSGNGTDIYRGTGSGSDSSDPTFNGIPGNLTSSEYFQYNGSQWFTLVGSNTTFFNSLHKSNAIYTIVDVFYAANITSSPTDDMGDIGTGGTDGIGLTFGNLSGTGTGLKMFVTIAKSPSTLAMSYTSTAACTNNAWNFAAMSFTESSGAGTFQINGTQETISGKSYSSPSSSNATYKFQVGAIGNNGGPDKSGCRVAGVLMWNRALSTTELTSLYTALRPRFGF